MKPFLHVLFLPSWYPKDTMDIGGSFFREQAIALHKKGHKVSVIAPPVIRSMKDVTGIFTKPYGLTFENDQGIATYRWHMVNLTPRLDKINEKRHFKIGIDLFEKYVKENGLPDILHVHSLVIMGKLALYISKKYKIPYIITEHSSLFASKMISEKNILELRDVVINSNKNLAVSNEFRNLLNKTFNVNSWHYLPNIVNNSFFNSNFEKTSSSKDFQFINICVLDKNKRVDILIKAFCVAFKDNKRVKLKIGGDGPEKNYLIKLVYKERLEDQITFLGSLSRNQVKNEIANSDAFVLSSEYETFGVVIIEALALGKPVVATKCGGPESIITPEVGYLVSKNSISALAEGMVKLYKNRDKYLSSYIREYCYSHFSEEVITNQLIKVYQNILNKTTNDF